MATIVGEDNEATTGASQNPMDDLSGVDTSAYDNPYDALISKANGIDKPRRFIQEAYETHRTTRNATKKAEIIFPTFEGVVPDQYLSNRLKDKDYVDPRNSLVFWARPPEEVLNLAMKIQAIIQEVMPSMWLMPPEDMHTTVLEVVHSVTMEDVMELANKLAPTIDELTALPMKGYGCTLFKPMVSFDAAAIALSFIPCSQTPPPSPHEALKPGYICSQTPSQTPSISSTPGPPTPGSQTSIGLPPWHNNPSNHQMYSQPLPGSMYHPSQKAPPLYPTQGSDYPLGMQHPIPDSRDRLPASLSNPPPTIYPSNLSFTQSLSFPSHVELSSSNAQPHKTYHHLRAALHSQITASGVPIASRYVVPSAHITLARYVTSSASSAYKTDLRKPEDELSHKNLVCLVHTIELINACLSSSRENDALSALASYDRIESQAREVLNIHNNAYSGPLLAPSLRSLEVRAKLSELGDIRWYVKDELVCRVGDLWYGGGFTVKTPEKGRSWKRGEAGTWWESGRMVCVAVYWVGVASNRKRRETYGLRKFGGILRMRNLGVKG